MILLRIYEDDHCVLKKIDWYPCVIGRSMHSDVSVGHSSVSGRHAIIEAFEDSFILRDFGSTNGVFHNGAKVESLILKKNEVVWIGDVKIEVVLDEGLPKTSPGRSLGESPTQAGFIGNFSAIAILLAGYLGALLVAIYQAYGRMWPPETMYPIFGKSFLLWGVGAAVAGGLALFSKVNVQKFYFRKIASIVFAFGFITYLVVLNLNTIIYNLRGFPGINFLDVLMVFSLAFGFAGSVMRLVLANLSGRVRILVSAILAVSAAFLVRWVQVDRNDGSGRTLATSLGVPLVDPAIAIDYDSDDLRGFFFRSIAEVDGERGRILERRGKALVEPRWESKNEDGGQADDDEPHDHE